MQEPFFKIRNQFNAYFLTFTVVGWVDIFSRKQCRDILIDSLKYCIDKKGLILYAYVVMTNHMHTIMAARPDSDGLSAIIRDFKKFTSKAILKWMINNRQESRRDWMSDIFLQYAKTTARNEHFQVWTHDNHPFELLFPSTTEQKLNYIHYNPVKAGFVRLPQEYLYSSAGNYYGNIENLLDVTLLDFGGKIGKVRT